MNEIPYEFLQAGGYFGPEFTSVFLFEDVFWRVVIPLMFGATSHNILNSLAMMPAEVRERLYQNPVAIQAYREHWADCLDYDMGSQMLGMQPLEGEAGDFLASAQRDLTSAITDLSQKTPNSNAMQNARVATEKAMKAFLCIRHSLTAEDLQNEFGHNVPKLAAEIVRLDPKCELVSLQSRIVVFAPYRERYSSRQYSRSELWEAYRCAQIAASSLVRALTPYNQRATMAS